MNSLNTTAAVVTLLSAALSVYFFVRSQRVKALAISYDAASIQLKTHPEIVIKYHDQEITNLARLRLVCWNRGRAAIRRNDMPLHGQPRIVSPDARVVAVSVLAASSSLLGFTATITAPNEVLLDFDYLNFDDGAVVEILYDTPRIPITPSFAAVIVDGEKLRVRRYLKSDTNQFASALLAFGAAGTLANALILHQINWSGWNPTKISPIFLIQLVLSAAFLILAWEGARGIRQRAANQLPEFARRFF